VGQAELVRTGEVSAEELVASAIERIEASNPAVNAMIWDRFDGALKEAAQPRSGLFAGVPLLLKDLGAPAKGHPMHNGCRVLKESGKTGGHDCGLVERFSAAGFIVLGRTNSPEFGLASETTNLAYGTTQNPWRHGRSAGGSSGGSGAAVAAGMVPVAHGTDGGGSVRIPACHCGLVGLKASRGRISDGPDVGDPLLGHNTNGVLTRTVRDAGAVLDAIAGPQPGDPTAAPRPTGTFREASERRPGSLRIGFVTTSSSERHPTHPAVGAAVEAIASLCEAAGHRVEESSPAQLFDERYWQMWSAALSPYLTIAVEEAIERSGADREDFDQTTQRWDAMARGLSAVEHTEAISWLEDFARRILPWWTDFDVLISPVMITPPTETGFLWRHPLGIDASIDILQFTPQFNTTGQPAIAIPADRTADGLPIGVQLVGRFGEEELLLALAAQIEEARPWAGHYPARWEER